MWWFYFSRKTQKEEADTIRCWGTTWNVVGCMSFGWLLEVKFSSFWNVLGNHEKHRYQASTWIVHLLFLLQRLSFRSNRSLSIHAIKLSTFRINDDSTMVSFNISFVRSSLMISLNIAERSSLTLVSKATIQCFCVFCCYWPASIHTTFIHL